MLTIRKFLKTLVGKATPFQVLFACLLGSLLGFLPVSGGGGAAILLVLVLLLVLNANVFLAGLVATGTKLLSIALAPLSFELGVLLIEGPTRPIFGWLVNAPVTAWMGLDRYLAAGGLVLGAVAGVALGLVVSTAVLRLRRTLGGLEEGSDAFRRLLARRPIRWACWVLFGGIPKEGFAATAARRGLPIRVSGVVAAVIAVGLAFGAAWFLSGPTAGRLLSERLTRLNGATVDVESLRVDWWRGRAELIGLEVCDPEQLDRNLVQARRLSADLDIDSLLRRRFAIDRVEVDDAVIEATRDTPGIRTEPREDPVPELPPERPEDIEGEPIPPGNLEEFLRTSNEWRERLRQVRRVVEAIAERVPGPDGTSEASSEAEPEDFETWLRSQVDLHGYAGVHAPDLIEGAPTLLVKEIAATTIRRADGEGPTYDLAIRSLSTQPRLVATPASIALRASDDSLVAGLELGGLAAEPTPNGFELRLTGLPAGTIVGQLVDAADPPFRGGTIDADLTGVFTLRPTIAIAAPLLVTLRDCTIRIAGESATIRELPVRIDIGGRLDDPALALDEKAFADSLQQAGADALADRAREEAGSQLDRGLQNLEKKTGVEIPDDLRKGIEDAIGGGLDGLFGGGKDGGDR